MTAFKSTVVLITLISISCLQAKPLDERDIEQKEDPLVEEFEYSDEYEIADDGQVIVNEGDGDGEDIPLDIPLNDEQLNKNVEEVEPEKEENEEINKRDDGEEKEDDDEDIEEEIEDEALEEVVEEVAQSEQLKETSDQKEDPSESDEKKNSEKANDDIAKEIETADAAEEIGELINDMKKEAEIDEAIDQDVPSIVDEEVKDTGVQTNSVDDKFIQRIEDEIVEEQNFVKDVAEAAEKRLLKHIVQEMEQEEERILENTN